MVFGRTQEKRRQLIKLLGLSFLSVSVMSRERERTSQKVTTKASYFQIVPLEGEIYPPSFLSWAKVQRFKSPQTAVKAVRNKNLKFKIDYV